MALEIYTRSDIERNIMAVTVAMLSAAIANGGNNVEYCRGVLDTARAQALTIGVSWSEMTCHLREPLAEVGYVIP